MAVNVPNAVSPGTLYLVATPIGNLKDITLRALEVLAAADIVLCEDTRMTNKLLSAHGIEAKLFAYHDKNGDEMRPKVMQMLTEQKAVALVSDAGTPLVSDPGYKLVVSAQEAGHAVTAIPGASAVLTALQLSGLPSDAFYFGGFMPRKDGERKSLLAGLGSLKATLVFFEAPTRLLDTLQFFADAYPEAEIAVARELTKRFEESARGKPAALHADFAGRSEGVLGEIVLVVKLPEQVLAGEALDDAIREALKEFRLKEAVQVVADRFGLSKNQVYDRALELKKETE